MLRLIVVLWIAVAAAHAATGWERLSELRPGDRIVVVQTDGKEYDGQMLRVTADSLSLRAEGSEITVERTKILRVTLRKSRRLRNALIGAGIGFAVSLTLDKTLGTYLNNETGYHAKAKALIWALPIGMGAVAGSASPGYPTVYRAPRP
jgi:hypothetical protein